MKRLLTILMMMAAVLAVHADTLLFVNADSIDVRVSFITPRTVHVTKTLRGKSIVHKSMVVTAKPQQVAATTRESGSEKIISSGELTVRVNKHTGSVAFEGRKVKNLLSEQSFGLAEIAGGPDRGSCQVSTTFRLQKDEPIYGLGTIQDGRLSHRGKKIRMEQSNLEDYQNVIQSIRGWALYWDNYSPTVFESPERIPTMTLSSEVGDGVDYYFMLGGSVDGNIREMRMLSGQVPMFPLWTYGYWQSKERYKSAREVVDVVSRYRQEQIPLDGIIQDWQYWGSNYTWNAMEFIAEDFKEGKRMIDEVHRKNAHFMISIWASFGPMTKQYRELDSLGLLYDFETWPRSGLPFWPPRMEYPSGVRVYDAFNPEARHLYWRYLKPLFDQGTDAWWMDSTDPDNFNMAESDYDHKAGDGTYRRYRNAYPLATVAGVYDHQRQVSDQKRVFIMTRSAFAGQQRYGSGLWSGDVQSSWDALRQQLPLGLNYSMTGCPNFNTDIGGFFCGSYNRRGGGSAPRNPQYQELYVRWMQYGLFCPVFRSHGTEAPREIWQFGKAGEPVYDAIAAQIRLRYRLLPYLYSTAWQVTSAGESYMRPLFADFPADRRTWQMAGEFLFGRQILAAPIVEAMYTPEAIDKSGKTTADFTATQTVSRYLPRGTKWYDFWTGQGYQGGRDVTLTTTFDRVPMFVRAGSILPLGAAMQYAGERPWDELELRVYPGADGTFTLYEDEGDNYNYEKGQYATITFAWNDKARTLTVGARQGSYKGMLTKRSFTIVTPDGQSQKLDYDGGEKRVKL